MKIYFGDNQFLGVNHSQGKGAEYLDKYASAEDIAATLRDAWQIGIRDFCFTVNRKTIVAVNLVIEECPFNLHPALPYAQGVNQLILEKGLIGAVYHKMRSSSFLSLCFGGGAALFGRYRRIFGILIRSELAGVPMENVRSIGLLNVATDFALGLNRQDILEAFYDSVLLDFEVKPFYYTMNFPMLADCLWGKGKTNCGIVFNYNMSGFRTNPSISAVETAIQSYRGNEMIAMSIFSGGDPTDSERGLPLMGDLSGVLFGSSNKDNIEKNFSSFSREFP